MISQAVGPVIGGLLNSTWGFRSIFWFLFSFSLPVLVALLVFLPETHRRIGGNGSVPLTGFQKPWLYLCCPPKEWTHATKRPTPNAQAPSFGQILVPLKYVLNRDIALLLSWGALVYTLWSMTTSSTTTVLTYTLPDLTQWQVGLCFLPNGVGCVLGSVCTGRLLDTAFKRSQEQYQRDHGSATLDVKTDKNFPLERARLSLMPYFSLIFVISLGLYGPSYELFDLRKHFAVNLAASLGLQFLIGFTATAVFNINSIMMVDIFPDSPAVATAVNNLCRCLLGAAGVSAIQPLIDAVRIRNAFLILTGLAILLSPLMWMQWRLAQKWRLRPAK